MTEEIKVEVQQTQETEGTTAPIDLAEVQISMQANESGEVKTETKAQVNGAPNKDENPSDNEGDPTDILLGKRLKIKQDKLDNQ